MRIPIVLFALTVHETAHGWMAMKLGDPTARNLGRLTLNPLKHLDPLGALFMLLFRFGWAKPVPINPRYFKHNRRDTALTAFAGPASNLILALIGMLLYHILLTVFYHVMITNEFAFHVVNAILQFLIMFISLNVSLAVFNLIPVPPLDGSRIFLVFLPPKQYFGVMKYERYIQMGLMVLLFIGVLDKPITMMISAVLNGMDWLVGLIPFLV